VLSARVWAIRKPVREVVCSLIFRPICMASFPFETLRERSLSYLPIVPGEPGQKDVMDV
jgi:hypothetical protein